MYRYSFSYKDLTSNSPFLRGHNVTVEQDDMKAAIDKFNEERPNSEIMGILKTKQ